MARFSKKREREKQEREARWAEESRQRREVEEAAQQRAEEQMKALQNQILAREASLLSKENALLYGKINGILETCASFVQVDNLAHVFSFTVVEKANSVEQALDIYFNNLDEPNANYELTEIVDCKQSLQQCLEQWLFGYEVPHNYPHDRVAFVSTLIEMMLQVAQPLRVWKVELQPVKFYELVWDDYALEGEKHLFFLHLGFYD